MDRRNFLAYGGIAAGSALVPSIYGRVIAAEELGGSIPIELKRRLADAALGAASDAGATYCDVRVGRYPP